MPSWNNIATSDGYQEFRFARVKTVTIAVSNAPILAQFAYISDNGEMRDVSYTYDGSERDMQNGIVWTWDAADDFNARGIVGLMVKSERPGNPALITIHA